MSKEIETKASIYMTKEEYKNYRKKAIDLGKKFSQYLLDGIRIGLALMGEYDWQDAMVKIKGEKPDRDWIKEDIKEKYKDLSLQERKKRLQERREATRQGKRFCEIQLEVIDEELEEVEDQIEKTKK